MARKIYFFNSLRRSENTRSYLKDSLELFKKNNNSVFSGSLLFQNNSNDTEPWIFGQELLSRTNEQQMPFIAVNPIYNHPYYTAKKIVTLTTLYHRKIYINFIIGTVTSDLEAMGDFLAHDERYDRLHEYIVIVQKLISSKSPTSYEGKYYQLDMVKLANTIKDEALLPTFYIAGSSEKAIQIRTATNSLNLTIGKPLEKLVKDKYDGIYLGILAKATKEEAQQELKERFAPSFSEPELLLEISMQHTDAQWKQNLMIETTDEVFRLEPFKHFNADCPYLVGSYEEVASYINTYIEKGIHTFIIDMDMEDFEEVTKVIELTTANAE